MVSLAIAQNPGETEQQFESSVHNTYQIGRLSARFHGQIWQGRVYVTLCTKEGRPIPFQEIQLTATDGAFSCNPQMLKIP